MSNNQGLKIVGLKDESYGASIGLELGDTILAYNSEPLNSVNQLVNLIKQNENAQVTYRIIRNGVEQNLQGESKTLDLTLQPIVAKVATGEVTVSSPLSVLFYVVAFVSLLGGIILGAKLWPESMGYGKAPSTVSYVYSWVWFTAGVVQFSIFISIGKTLAYLKQIVANTSAIAMPNK